ncbi:MAG TPA: DUF2062 domain-containing protein [Gammaproteobacteria bacterium]|nr:DUF2062 domain-containing protein [Gammaproteobacteria bacterium]
MPKRLLKRYLPDHDRIREHRHLKCFGSLLHDPNLWHLNRRSVPGAFSVGLFMAFVPVPFQMFLAAAGAICLRVNLPISVALVWITNPLTMGPIFYLAYKAGALILNQPTRDVSFALTIDWLTTQLGQIWQPFLLGCLLFGTLAALLGNLLIRGFWRFTVRKHWHLRRERRRQREAAREESGS